MKNPSIISLGSAVNRAYALPFWVMLNSLLANLDPSRIVRLFMLETAPLDPSFRAGIENLVETHWVNPAVSLDLSSSGRYGLEALCPLMLPASLPVDRVLFLDADLLVLGDISQLWDTDLQGQALGAVVDLAMPLVSSPRAVKGWSVLGISPNAPYFNAGVLLIDLNFWRNHRIVPQALDYLSRHQGCVDFAHQEALNAVAWNCWTRLSPRWNLSAGLAHLLKHDSGKPGIVHFSGRFKPWRLTTGSPYQTPYNSFLQDLPHWLPRTPTRWQEWILSLYARHVRTYLYPLERFLWERRWI